MKVSIISGYHHVIPESGIHGRHKYISTINTVVAGLSVIQIQHS